MTNLEQRLTTLEQQILAESNKIQFDGQDTVTPLIEELQHVCPHIDRVVNQETGEAICERCGKLFMWRGSSYGNSD